VKYKYKFSPGMTYTYIGTISFLKGTIHNQALCATEAVVEHVIRGWIHTQDWLSAPSKQAYTWGGTIPGAEF